MVKRNQPQARTDEKVWPVRVMVFVPTGGFGARLAPLLDWMDVQFGRTGYAWHSGHFVRGQETVAIYLLRPEDGATLIAAWPWLELADGTKLERYRHPREYEVRGVPGFRY